MDKLKELILSQSVSGYEYKSSHKVAELFKESGADVFTDKLSNVIAVKNKGKSFKVLLDAHFDTIGLMVTKIEEGGFLKFVAVGGVDPRILPSLSVNVCGRENIPGVIGVKPPHLLKDGKDKAYKIEELFIDTGKTKEELEKIVEIGDVVTFKSDYTELLNGRIASSGLDDKVGIFMIGEILKQFSNSDITLYGIGAVGEEIGLKGAKVISNTEDFDLCIAIDVTHGITPDAIKNRAFELGEGPVLTFGPSLSKKYNNMLLDFAKEENIPCQIEVEPGNTGTDAWAYHSARCSNPSVMLSIPLRYMHTSYEVMDKKDVYMGIELIVKFLNSLEVEKDA